VVWNSEDASMLISSFYVVLFEENDEDFYRVTELLRWHHADVLVRRVVHPGELRAMAGGDDTTDLILIDIDNPAIGGPSGLDSFSGLLEAFPVIAFGERRFREDILASMRQGLQDFFAKWEVDRDQLGYLLARAWSRRHLITKLRLAEHRAWEEGDAKSRFLARMSHEIRTPLVSILGFSQLLADGQYKKDQTAEFVRALQNNGRFLLALLDNVLTSSQLEGGEFRLHVGRGDVPKRFVGDVTRLTQVLVNLIVNAVKYTERGQVTLSVWREGEGQLEFAVSDTGRGLSEAGRRVLFQEFSRTEDVASRDTPGVGLGLFVAQSIVRRMGGYISVESEMGVGSTFRILLPLRPVIEEQVSDIGGGTSRLNGHVLLVEDAVDSARYIGLLLEDLGLSVEIAPTAEECLRLIDDGERFQVILMDIGLPGMDGLSAIRELRARNIEAPILALSAHAFEEEVDACIRAGADAYLTKPFRVQDFLRTVSARLAQGVSHPVGIGFDDGAVRVAVGKGASTEGRLHEIRHRFVSSLEKTVAVIREAEARSGWAEIREQVHKIAGSAGLLGYPVLSDMARDAEVTIKRGETTTLAGNLDDIEREVHRIVEGFETVDSKF
jgi:signal transduction histidine kinase/ActR/RegA family two-component response regulator/HPt (histidine-containing phosphotransfer) domain-containing protein